MQVQLENKSLGLANWRVNLREYRDRITFLVLPYNVTRLI